ncbi:MAG: hypothetical protein PHI55_02425 [Burkholderiaceae bacterium]|nr:hypothetical protein [Burkholderiaceae bacterium]
MLNLLRHWKTHVRDALELVLLPGLAAVLPWRVCFAVFKRLARWDWLYRAPCHAALREARLRGQCTEAEAPAWLARRRLVTLVDHADLYLALTRSDAWMRRHLAVQGTWPAGDQAGIFCTFHWGAGMWGLRHARRSGLQAHALVAAMEGAHFAGRPVLHRYVKARTRQVEQALAHAPLDVSASLRPALRALRQGQQVMAAVDVPSDQVAASVPVVIAGMATQVPKALLRLAVEQKIPVTVYWTGLDTHTGQRFLHVRPLGLHDSLDTLVPAVFQHLETLLAQDSAAWHFWGEAPRFFGPPPTAH